MGEQKAKRRVKEPLLQRLHLNQCQSVYLLHLMLEKVGVEQRVAIFQYGISIPKTTNFSKSGQNLLDKVHHVLKICKRTKTHEPLNYQKPNPAPNEENHFLVRVLYDGKMSICGYEKPKVDWLITKYPNTKRNKKRTRKFVDTLLNQ